MKKGWTIIGSGLWIIGLVLFVLGLNLTNQTKDWLTVIGSILFLIGLGITGAIWMIRKKETDE